MGELTALADRLRRDRRRDPYAGRREYSADARDLAAGCERLIATGQAEAAVPILRKAVDRMTTALMYMDDSSGIVGDDLREMMALYARACAAAPPKPKTLAGWLVRLEFDGPGWPAIRLVEFVPALGEPGIAEVARLVEERAASADPDSWGQVFAVRDLREQLAEVSGDVDRYVAVLAQHLESAHQYRRIVAALRKAGRVGDAIDWASRGLAAKGGWPETEQLRDELVAMLLETGQAEQAVTLRREEFARHPSLSAWRGLRATAVAAGAFSGAGGEPALEFWALEVLRERVARQSGYLRELIEVQLDCGDAEAAWQSGVDHRDQVPADLLLRLLRVRRLTHPLEVVDPYRQLIEDQVLDSRDKYRYKRAVTLLRELREVHVASGDLAAFGGYLDELRARHKRRPTFLATLDRGRW